MSTKKNENKESSGNFVNGRGRIFDDSLKLVKLWIFHDLSEFQGLETGSNFTKSRFFLLFCIVQQVKFSKTFKSRVLNKVGNRQISTSRSTVHCGPRMSFFGNNSISGAKI